MKSITITISEFEPNEAVMSAEDSSSEQSIEHEKMRSLRMDVDMLCRGLTILYGLLTRPRKAAGEWPYIGGEEHELKWAFDVYRKVTGHDLKAG